MSVIIDGVEKKSPAKKAGIKPKDILLKINGNEITDVLDYRFYEKDKNPKITILRGGKEKIKKIHKPEWEEIGLTFSTYLMDRQQSCKNKCIFCFIDQMPKGLREPLYFKDDDSRLSFLFGNYITLTNISEHEIERIIKMHISPVNISVHTTNPELRVKMMKNKNAGKALETMKRFSDAGITMNCQLVLCPGINDGDELKRSIRDLTSLPSVKCIAAVPVGLTKYRDGLEKIEGYSKQTSAEVIDIIESFGKEFLEARGDRVVYAADEFYLMAERDIPDAEFYGEFLQLENGVGLWALLLSEFREALKEVDFSKFVGKTKEISLATGAAAFPLINEIVNLLSEKWNGFKGTVYAVKNNFFGEKINVAGLVTGTDIIEQLNDKPLYSELILPDVMLRHEGDMFLDSITVEELEERLNIKTKFVSSDGYELLDALLK